MKSGINNAGARRTVLASALILSTSVPALSWAQTSTVDPPARSVVDENGVDLSTGSLTMQLADVSIGDPSAGGLGHSVTWLDGAGMRDQYNAVLVNTSNGAQVSIGGATTSFSRSGNNYTSEQADGATLAMSGANYIYTMADGTAVTFIPFPGSAFAGIGGWTPTAIATEIVKPNGQKLTLNYYSDMLDARGYGGTLYVYFRLASVTSSTGFQLRYSYASDGLDLFNSNTNTMWMTISGVTAVNNAVDCATCSLSQAWPTATYGLYGTFISSITDAAGLVTNFTNSNGNIGSIRRPGHSSTDIVVTKYNSDPHAGKIYQIVKGGNTTTYSWSLSGATMTATISDTLSRSRTVVSDTVKHVIVSETDGANHTTSYGHDNYGRLTSVVLPLGQSISYVYDSRGNVTLTTRTPVGSGDTDILTSASYPTLCLNAKTCNQPTTTTDARGKTTNYYYDSNTGLVTQVVAPADANGVRPTTNYGYTALYAWYKNASGALVQAATPVSMLTSVSTCQTSSSCTLGSVDEARTTIGYETGSSSAKSNLLPTTLARGSGSNPAMQVVTSAFDAIGNVVSVDGPLSGSNDTARMYYDADRRLIGAVTPDPDGVGSLKPQAIKYSYNGTTGLLDKVENGTVTNPTDNPSSLTVLDTVSYTYDTMGRKLSEAHGPAAAPIEVTAFAYDAAGRLTCTAVRMNMSSLPADACARGADGASGPDRITKTAYNELDQVTSVQQGYLVAPETLASYTYTANGQVAAIADGKGNTTSYEYDGHSRRVKTRYPNPGGAGISATDYEEVELDAGGLVTSLHKRGYSADITKRVDYSYDDLGRATWKHAGDGSVADVYYGYDLLGRMTYARFGSTSGAGITNTFDALGQLTSTSTNMSGSARTLNYLYDAAGNRERITHPDGAYFASTFDKLNRYTHSDWWTSAGGTVSFAQVAYDDLGRRSSITRGLSISEAGFDAASRLTSLKQRFAGNVGNLESGLSYNPAGQITSRTHDNADFAFSGYVNVNRGYVSNGLNQYATVGGKGYSYDARGNLISDGTESFSYDIENRMVGKNGTVGLTYDPLGRLFSVTMGGNSTQFLYDGDQLAAEYNGAGVMTKRYMFAGTDEPILEDGGALNCSSTRFLSSDERGSIVAQADCSGNRTAVNRYDEYGIRSTGNTGRFQYTGQAWLSELGLYYYKARMYSPTLGRFMQTDPIGYADGPNWYAYVGNDPVNAVDPTGLAQGGVDIQVTGTRIPGMISTGGGGPPLGLGSDPGVLNTVATFGLPDLITVTGGKLIRHDRSSGLKVSVGTTSGLGVQVVVAVAPDSLAADIVDIVVTGVRRVKDIEAKARKYLAQPLLQDIHDLLISEACCFTAGTLVSTPSGLRPIETLKIGDMVVSRSDKTGETAAKPIVSITPAHERRIWAVTVSYRGADGRWMDERYETTDDHPWRTADGRWVASASLKPGQVLAREDGTAIVAGIVNTSSTKLTYNLEIADFHSYFVGKAEIWVHNQCYLRPNQMNKLVQQGRAPRGIGRTDIGKIKGEQQHTIIEGIGALNIDGSWKHGGGVLTRAQAEFLSSNGYVIP